jgi:hypothetical protein
MGDSSVLKGCSQGLYANNKIVGNKMGGLFLNACTDMLITGSFLWSNGSRNATIEQGCININMIGNYIRDSGRQGIWGWGYQSGLIIGNHLYLNGRKGSVSGVITTQNIMMSGYGLTGGPTYPMQQCDVLIAHNYSEADAIQLHNIEIGQQLGRIVVSDNILRGAMRRIHNASAYNGLGSVDIKNNDGWKTENSGRTTLTGDGATTQFNVPHGLDIENIVNLNYGQIRPRLTPMSAAAAAPVYVATPDITNLQLNFLTPPANGAQIILDWEAKMRLTYG